MKKRCFVIQGFGKKQDYQQGKQFDLNASYKVIKDAIEAAGLDCVRADEVNNNVMIDKIMFQQLLSADLVVADITTLNFNAAYELGVRQALRPYTTLVVAENGINFPFDINHIPIHTYKHQGSRINPKEAKRFKEQLQLLAQNALSAEQKDSPVYVFLENLPKNGFIDVAEEIRTPELSSVHGPTLSSILNQAQLAMSRSKFTDAISLWKEARKLAGKNDYIVQQLALATYKSKQPNEESALRIAKQILEYLKPHDSFDTETLGLWGSVHKRLFEISKNAYDLDESIFALERGFFVMQDYYNGINLAFMLDVKATITNSAGKAEFLAVARYTRRKVKDICVKTLGASEFPEEEKYWILATMYEACVGLGEEDEAATWKEEAEKTAKANWMSEATNVQINKLRLILN
jgi:hypothetical protein